GSPSSITPAGVFPDWAGLVPGLARPNSWRRMGLRLTATATFMLAKSRGPIGLRPTKINHGRTICARFTNSGRSSSATARARASSFRYPLALILVLMEENVTAKSLSPAEMEGRIARFNKLQTYQRQNFDAHGIPPGAVEKITARRVYP